MYRVYEKSKQYNFRGAQEKWSHDGPQEESTKRNVSGADGDVPEAMWDVAAAGKHGRVLETALLSEAQTYDCYIWDAFLYPLYLLSGFKKNLER